MDRLAASHEKYQGVSKRMPERLLRAARLAWVSKVFDKMPDQHRYESPQLTVSADANSGLCAKCIDVIHRLTNGTSSSLRVVAGYDEYTGSLKGFTAQHQRHQDDGTTIETTYSTFTDPDRNTLSFGEIKAGLKEALQTLN